MKIIYVIPVFNERETVRPLAEGIIKHTPHNDFKILFIDDGSTDGSYQEILALQQDHPQHVTHLRLRGNFGKSVALAAGFAQADADLIFTMDSDLQDDPKEIPRFLDKLEEGFDVVCGWKAVRHDPWHKTYPSRVYNAIVSWLFGLPIHDVNCGFKLMRREVVKHIRLYGEMHRLIPVYAHSLNFRVTEIPVEHHRRKYGKSKFGFERFTRGAIDVFTTWFLTRYRTQPAHFFAKLGMVKIALAFPVLLAGFSIAAPSIKLLLFMLAVALVLGGGLLVGLGLLAEFLLYHFVRIDPALYIAENTNHTETQQGE